MQTFFDDVDPTADDDALLTFDDVVVELVVVELVEISLLFAALSVAFVCCSSPDADSLRAFVVDVESHTFLHDSIFRFKSTLGESGPGAFMSNFLMPVISLNIIVLAS